MILVTGGAGYIGSGTTLVDVRRIYNEFLHTQVRSSTALNRIVFIGFASFDVGEGGS